VARVLGEVFHYMIPEPGSASSGSAAPPPLVCVPLWPRDVVRGALVWNLAVEAARQGASVSLVAPSAATCSSWPPPGCGPLGVELAEVAATDLDAFAEAALGVARRAAGRAGRAALSLATVPAAWLRADASARRFVRWVLLLTRPDERDLLETWGVLESVAAQAPWARLGACVFGVRSLADARHAFEGLAALAELELERQIVSYGVLIDDVHLSRAIVTRRPIPLAQPGCAAARALSDVASMLLEDARTEAASGPAHG
jgi:hypothetical protein